MSPKGVIYIKRKEVKIMENICANCRYYTQDGYCQLLDKKTNSNSKCCDFEED